MTTEQRPVGGTPEVELAGDGPRCGKLVAQEDDHELLCDLPAGHPDSTPCSASLPHEPLIERGVD